MIAISGSTRSSELDFEVVRHQLRVFGWPHSADVAYELIVNADAEDCGRADNAAARGQAVVALLPDDAFCKFFAVEKKSGLGLPPRTFRALGPPRWPGRNTGGGGSSGSFSEPFRLRTLRPYFVYRAAESISVVVDNGGEGVWIWIPRGRSGILFIGTDLSGDNIRYRQGDPALARTRLESACWGAANERPNYLFEPQRLGEPPYIRHADEWIAFLISFLARMSEVTLDPILPEGAPGCVVLTGDDDVAELDAYEKQLEVLGEQPITYFMHKLSRHDAASLARIRRRKGIDFGFHPDALDAPDEYRRCYQEQLNWLAALGIQRPRSIRNHGFLNDGYWGHLSTWLDYGVEISSNLPGFDGNILNGSLLPGRVAYDNQLTDHWSILTAIGDGIVFVNDWTDSQARNCLFDAADRVRDRAIPGSLVLNLHPANIERTRALHDAALAIIDSGFVAWNIEDCLDWFRRRDLGETPLTPSLS
jgi:hypothetical protein